MTTETESSASGWGMLAAIWGVAGVVGILGLAVVRLFPIAVDAFDHELSRIHWFALAGNIAFMLYFEGYRGFQTSFSPRVADRAARLARRPTWVTAMLAPLFCIGYFKSSGRLKATVYGLTAGIIVLVLLVQRLGQPWRGIIDAGVVGGLSWGIVSTLVYALGALRGRPVEHSAHD